jgi:hypothetical protein
MSRKSNKRNTRSIAPYVPVHKEDGWSNIVCQPSDSVINYQGQELHVFKLEGSEALQLTPPSNGGQHRFHLHPLLSPHMGALNYPEALSSVTLETYDGQCFPVLSPVSNVSLFGSTPVPSGVPVNGHLDPGNYEASLCVPIDVWDTTSGEAYLAKPFAFQNAQGKNYILHPLGFANVDTGSGTAINGQMQFSRALQQGESLALAFVYTDLPSGSSHTQTVASVTSGMELSYSTFVSNSQANCDALHIRLTVNLQSELTLMERGGGGIAHSLMTFLGTSSNHTDMSVATNEKIFGPTGTEIEQLMQTTGTDRLSILGMVMWLVASPTATDRSRITMGTLTLPEAQSNFLSREKILRYCSEKDRGFFQGRDGAIGISTPSQAPLYARPARIGQLQEGMTSIFAELDFGSQSELTFYFQWAVCVGAVIQNPWLPRPIRYYEPEVVGALIGLCSRMDTVYENKNHSKLIRKGLKKVMDVATSEPVKSMAKNALATLGPLILGLL